MLGCWLIGGMGGAVGLVVLFNIPEVYAFLVGAVMGFAGVAVGMVVFEPFERDPF